MPDNYKLQRPEWCPSPDCKYLVNSQNALCFGLLPEPVSHAGIDNTHRMCMHGAKDDGAWTVRLQINKGDAANIHRLIGFVFEFKDKQIAEPTNSENT